MVFTFSFKGFPRKNCCLIVVDLLVFSWLCCWVNCLLNLFLAHKVGKIIFRIIVFGSLSQHLIQIPLKYQRNFPTYSFMNTGKMLLS